MNALPRESNMASCQPDINLSIAALASQQDSIHVRPDKLNGRFRKERDQLNLIEILNNRSNPDDVFLKAMCSEYNRLVTYSDFPNCDSELIEDMAESGFFYTGQIDRVQCVFCRGVLKNWRPRDIPRDEHRKHFPLCPFVCGHDTGNEAVLFYEQSKQTKRNESPDYSSESERLRSFLNWPRNHHQAVADMVQAGFFYLGHGDKVKCFRCGGVLGDWEALDIPWKEHARWYPHCNWAKRLMLIHTL